MNPYEPPPAPHPAGPQPAASWPHASSPYPSSRQTTLPRLYRPGVETRQVLLALGSLCLVVAFSAGTALVWGSLGRGGQVALMAAVTAVLLTGAATVRRLPATAEALGVVGLAGCAIDATAARTLHLSAADSLPLHWYVVLAALAIGLVAATLTLVAPRLVSAPLAWAGALLVAAVAATNPTALDRVALLTPVGIAVALVIERSSSWLHRPDAAVRILNAALGGAVAVVGFAASLLAATEHDPAALYGATLPLALLALPLLAHRPGWVADDASASLSGVSAAMLLTAVALHSSSGARVLAALVLPALAVGPLLFDGAGWVRRLRIAVVPLVFPAAIAWLSLIGATPRFADVNFALAAGAAAVAALWPASRQGSALARGSALAAAVVFASVAAGITLDLHAVTAPEAYTATPVGLGLAWGAALLRRDRQLSSAVLLPALFVGLLPPLLPALGPDAGRRAVLLVAATVLVCLGAELRLATPLAAGATVVGLLSLRVAGPMFIELPHWLMWFAAGAVLLTLGATWEARVADARNLKGLIRPRLAALR
ncbi:MAG TPA: hypothetical protein VG650_14135 [Mycobacteriales bacterium]|nr:hypothetical protein [Mycobacteriales bacterium]